MEHAVGAAGKSFHLTWLLAATLAPFFLLAWFSHPAADDFVYATRANELGFGEAQRFWYLNWTGRYFATALQTGFPLALDMLRAYPLVPLVTLASFLLSLAILAKTLNGRLQEPLERGTVWVCILGLAAIYVTQMPGLVDGFYWLAGAATYALPLSLVLLLLACLLSSRTETPGLGLLGRGAAAAALSLAIAGSSETMIAPVNVVLLVGTALALRRKHPGRWVWIAASAACLAGSLAVVLAPGNAQRAMHFDRPPLAGCAAACLWGAIRHALKWSSRPMLLGATILAIPLAGKLVGRVGWARRITGRHVAAAVATTVALVVLSFAPAYLGIGRKPPPRAMNVAYFFFLAGWFATLLAAVAWRQNAHAGELRLSVRAAVLGRIALIAGALLVGHWPRAVYDLTCLAPSYDRQLRTRYAMLYEKARSGESEAVVEGLSARPKSLLFSDFGDDLSQTDSIARYFGLRSLVVVDPVEGPGS